jgi:hypothetical protein
MVSVREWVLPMVEEFWQVAGQRAGKRFPYHPNLATKNDNKKSIF